MADIIKKLPLLPSERALKIIAGRWKAIVLYHLFSGSKRLSELKKLVPDVSQKMLIQQLRELEEHGLVSREVFAEVPARVEYSATDLGSSLQPLLLALCQWGQHHASETGDGGRISRCIIKPSSSRAALEAVHDRSSR